MASKISTTRLSFHFEPYALIMVVFIILAFELDSMVMYLNNTEKNIWGRWTSIEKPQMESFIYCEFARTTAIYYLAIRLIVEMILIFNEGLKSLFFKQIIMSILLIFYHELNEYSIKN